jgi:hypothetical protein
MSTSAPVVALALLGSLIAALGLIVAGSIVVISSGLFAIYGAGLLQVAGGRAVR